MPPQGVRASRSLHPLPPFLSLPPSPVPPSPRPLRREEREHNLDRELVGLLVDLLDQPEDLRLSRAQAGRLPRDVTTVERCGGD